MAAVSSSVTIVTMYHDTQ